MHPDRRPRASLWKRLLGAAFVLALVFAAGAWAGAYVTEALQQRMSLPFRAKYKLVGFYNSIFRSDAQDQRGIGTNRVPLVEQTVFLSLDAGDYGGGITTLPDDSVVILDRPGTFFRHAGGGVEKLALVPPDNGMAALKAQLDAGELADAWIDFKQFRHNDVLHVAHGGRSHLFASYTEWMPAEHCFVSTLAAISFPGDLAPADWSASEDGWRILQRTRPCLPLLRGREGIRGLEAGGRLAHLGGSVLVWTSGAYERDDYFEGTEFSRALAQDPDSDYGKVLAVDFLSGEMRHMASGLRNPQGIDVDPAGKVWVTDHGMRGGDELNLVREGANFGFPAVSYGTRYNRKPVGDLDRYAGHEGYDEPVMAFAPAIAPSSVLAITGFHYAWDGDILVGAFDGFVYRVHLDGDRAVLVEPVRLDVRTRDLDATGDGRIVVWTDDRRLVFLSPGGKPDPLPRLERQVAAIGDASVRSVVTGTLDACLRCHGLEENETRAGPSLHGICGSDLGSGKFDAYSGALQAAGGIWTTSRLAAFIADPQAVAPGTTMAWSGLADERAAAVLAEHICGATGELPAGE